MNDITLTLTHPAYPMQLKQINHPPAMIYVKGDPTVLSQPQIAIVGSRNPTPIGQEIAFEFAAALADAGFCITSGMAIGIDGAAHRGALYAKGQTIAVLGNGLATVYPRRHRHLASQISQRGALLSEFQPDAPPHARHFPQRNRIISGLSLGTLVIEATLKSGSLITAQFAIEQNRDVFAVPGSIHNPLAKGCHHLIRQGAKLVESVDDILAEFAFLSLTSLKNNRLPKKTKTRPMLEANEQKLVECIGFEVTSIDQVITRSGLPAPDVAAILLNLELHGYIKGVRGGYLRVGE